MRPDFEKPFLLDTDFSYNGLGATLSQIGEDGREHPIAFASRSLQAAENNYPVTDGELLAMIWAVTSRFRPYLYGHHLPFTIRTDHNPLVWLQTQKNLSGRLARRQIKLMEYNFVVVHRSGKIHSNVDPLSRNPAPAPPTESSLKDLDNLPDSVGFPPTVTMIQGDDEEEDVELAFWGDPQYYCWIGRPRTPPVQSERNTAQFIRHSNVYPITFQELSPSNRLYMAEFASSREPRPALSDEETPPEQTRDGLQQGGSSILPTSGESGGDPPASPRDPGFQDEETPEPEGGSPPGFPDHKYKEEESGFPALDTIPDGRSTAFRISDHF
jgi:hypothetical protein